MPETCPEDRPSSPAGLHAVFAGGGELGRAMAERDWAATPLGPPDAWPAELRGAVRILLTSRFSMWMAWGPELTFFYNDAYRRDTLRAKHPWALGRPAHEVWAEIWDDIGPRIGSVLAGGAATWDEELLLFLERSGYTEETYHTFSYSPLGDVHGRAEGMLCVVAEVTDRVLSERRMATLRDLAAAVAATRTKEDVLAAVGEQLSGNARDLPFALVYLFDDDGSARLACSTGIEAGAPAAPAVVEPDDDRPAWPVATVRRGQAVLVDGLADRFARLPCGAWTQPPALATVVPVASAQGQGQPAGFLVVGLNPFRAYDDRYASFVELLAGQIAAGLVNAGSYEAERRRAEALAELDRAKTDFFANVSHEFRTPLTLIMGPVEELRAAPVLDGERVRAELAVVHRNALRLGKLVNSLLDFSRLQAGRIQTRFEPVDLAAVTAELASVFRSAIEKAGLTFTVDCPPLPDAVWVDRDSWEKVVLNLLSNALKFTFTGSVTVALRAVDGSAALTVADTGTGIPAAELPHLFERFHRVRGARARSGEGSGIGLAMVRELVALHGGRIVAESTPDVGSTFTITLPLGRTHLPPDQTADGAARPAAGATVSAAAEPFVAEALRWLPDSDGVATEPLPAGPAAFGSSGDPPTAASGRVLVADDNADMREYLQRLLAPHYPVQVVGDGRAALAAALADPPDLVVSDVMMPGLDGMELLAALRADTRTARVPVLLLSARAGQEAAVEGLASGADDYLVKPFAAAELLARVGAHLQLGRVRREAEERFTAMADLAPALIWVSEASGRRVFLSSGWQRFTGCEVEAELGDGWKAGVHPADRQRYQETVAAARAAQQPWEIEFRLRRADGTYHWLLEHAVPVGAAGGGPGGYVGSAVDINARHREGERQRLLAEVGAALDGAPGVGRQLDGLARLMVDTRLADVCTVRLVDDEERPGHGAVAALDAETGPAPAGLDPGSDLARRAVADRRAVVAEDVAPDGPGGPRADDPGEGTADRDAAVRSGIAAPLVARGRVLGVLGLGRRADSPFYTADDAKLVEEVASRAALALDNALLLAEERATAARLALLQRATAELSAATTPAQVAAAADTHIRQLLDGVDQFAVFEADAANGALTALLLTGVADEARQRWSTLSLQSPLPAATAVVQERPVWVGDLTEVDVAHDPEQAELIRSFGARGGGALPLLAAGHAVGVMVIGFSRPRRLTRAERNALQALVEPFAQALDRARLYRTEHRIAAVLQQNLLPQRLPRLPRLALAARYLPAAEGTQAGGDWFDVLELDDHRGAIVVGDVVGHGPGAAAVMGQLRSSLATALLQGHDPVAALDVLDRFARRTPGARSSTAVCLVLDWAAGQLHWARAGHPPPLLIGSGRVRYLEQAWGTVLGVPRRPPFTAGVTEIEPGDSLLLYTDGLVERRDETVDAGLDRLAACARRRHTQPPEQLVEGLLRDLLADADQADDIALIAVRLQPGSLHGRLPARAEKLSGVRRAAREWAAKAGLPEELVDDLQLALGEAVANGVEHAYRDRPAGEVEYTLSHDADGVAVRVRDFGAWRPEPADKGYRGRGLALIRALAENGVVDVAGDGAGGTTVSFRLPPLPGDGERRPGPLFADIGSRATPAPPDEPDPAVLQVHPGRRGTRLEIRGGLDLAGVDALRAPLLGHLARVPAGETATLDLRGTTYLASAGVAVLLEAVERAGPAGVTLRVLTAPGSVPARVLAVSGVDRLLAESEHT